MNSLFSGAASNHPDNLFVYEQCCAPIRELSSGGAGEKVLC